MPNVDLPAYETLLASYHRAFAPELKAMIAALPLAEGDKVVEIACGDGAYTPWLAEQVGPRGVVVAIDVSLDFLKVAHAHSTRTSVAARVAHVAAPIERLPLADGTFDLVWCAQSLYSLPDQLAALKRMGTLARPGGRVAVLENDTVHQLVLPWPVEIELAVRAAEYEAFAAETDEPDKYYIGRRLAELFHDAGLTGIHARSFASTRQAPLPPPERTFLTAYLQELRERVADRLKPALRSRFLALVDSQSASALINQPQLTFTCLDHVVSGVRPL